MHFNYVFVFDFNITVQWSLQRPPTPESTDPRFSAASPGRFGQAFSRQNTVGTPTPANLPFARTPSGARSGSVCSRTMKYAKRSPTFEMHSSTSHMSPHTLSDITSRRASGIPSDHSATPSPAVSPSPGHQVKKQTAAQRIQEGVQERSKEAGACVCEGNK